jgi:hypothetical protein
MQWGRTDRVAATAAYDGASKVFNADGAIPESGLRLIIDQGRAEANITREVSATEVADLTPLRAAQKQLGIKGR